MPVPFSGRTPASVHNRLVPRRWPASHPDGPLRSGGPAQRVDSPDVVEASGLSGDLTLAPACRPASCRWYLGRAGSPTPTRCQSRESSARCSSARQAPQSYIESPAPLEQVRAGVGRLDRILGRVRQRRLDDLARMVRHPRKRLKVGVEGFGRAVVGRVRSCRFPPARPRPWSASSLQLADAVDGRRRPRGGAAWSSAPVSLTDARREALKLFAETCGTVP